MSNLNSEDILHSHDDADNSSTLDSISTIRRLRTKLLDLTGSNRLLNFKYTRRTIRFVSPNSDQLHSILSRGDSINLKYIPLPEIEENATPSAKDCAVQLDISTSYDVTTSDETADDLQTLLFPKDLERVARILYNDNKLAVEESGNHSLYLVNGFLQYHSSENTDAPSQVAPLLIIPVSLNRVGVNPTTGLYTYSLKALDEDELVHENNCLREKLNYEFGFQLPKFEENFTPSDYFKVVTDACSQRKNWSVLPQLTLCLLSFKKISLWSDLDIDKNPEILDHPLMKKIFGFGNTDQLSNEGSSDEYEIDSHPLAELPIIYDADSSQHSALIDALEGKNLVIVGPPGTGKSQTITNLIALGMSQGKRVLFVSEKKAALEVVYKRLELAGLSPFCLELHSNKSSKKDVLDSLEKRMIYRSLKTKELSEELTNLRNMKKRLNSYASTVNQSIGISGDTSLHKIIWKLEKNRQSLGNIADALQLITWEEAFNWNQQDLNQRRQLINEYVSSCTSLDVELDEHPLNGVKIHSSSPSEKRLIENTIIKIITAFDGLIASLNSFETTFDSFSLNACKEWLDKLEMPQSISMESPITIRDCEAKSFNQFSTHLIESTYRQIQALDILLRESKKIHLPRLAEIEMLPLSGRLCENISISQLHNLRSEIESALKCLASLTQFCTLEKLKAFSESLNFKLDRLDYSTSVIGELKLQVNSILSNLNVTQFSPFIGSADFASIKHAINETKLASDELEKTTNILKPLCNDLKLKQNDSNYSDILHNFKIIFEKYPSILLEINLDNAETFTTLASLELICLKQKNPSLNFKLDSLPSVVALETLIQKIRSPNLWSFFSNSYRHAKKSYNRMLLNERIPVDSHEVTELIEWCKLRDKFIENHSDTPLLIDLITNSHRTDELNALIEWYRKIRSLLQRTLIETSNSIFPTNESIISIIKNSPSIDRTLSLRTTISNNLETLTQAVTSLENLSVCSKSVVSNDVSFENLALSSSAWENSLILLKKLGYSNQINSCHDLRTALNEQLHEINQILSRYSHASTLNYSLREIQSFAEAHKNYIALYDQLCTNELLKSLELDDHLLNIDKLNLLKNSFAQALSIKELNLPTEFECIILHDITKIDSVRLFFKELIDYSNEIRVETQTLMSAGLSHENLNQDSDVFEICKVEKTKKDLEEILINLDALENWSTYCVTKDECFSLGLSELILIFESNKFPSNLLIDAFDYIYHNSCINAVYKEIPKRSLPSGSTLDDLRSRFAELDQKIVNLNGSQLAFEIARREIPLGRRAAKASDQTGLVLIQHEISKKKRHIPIRKLLTQAGEAAQALKPCFLMSPLAVAQYIPKGTIHFDLLIIDEASQMRLPESFGSILRSKQMVVVGDPKQLPPTNFFEKNDDDIDDNDEIAAIEDGVESILDRCMQVFNTPRLLRWHYRSHHESLISFSNYHFYDNRLIVMPSYQTLDPSIGLQHHYIADAIYLDRTNRIEAERLVEAVEAELLKRTTYSVGIVALNNPQRDLINELFQQRLNENSALREIVEQLDTAGHEVFIKNLENVQGDERDVIFISTVYGKPPSSSVVRQTFGPINGASGWRRLNVLFTRARRRIELYTSLRSEDIVISEKSALGLKVLKNYLYFAETKEINRIHTYTGEADSPFETAVADFLIRNGYEVQLQLGVNGFWIDIVVKHPENMNTYLAAIECDGATYHSSRSARDRDRIRQTLLENQGWKGKIFRIWSTDWFNSPLKQGNKLLDFLADLRFNASDSLQCSSEANR